MRCRSCRSTTAGAGICTRCRPRIAIRTAADIAIALADAVVDGEASRIGPCSAVDCDALFVDLSRNRSKRFCDRGNCANRTHVAAYRARHTP